MSEEILKPETELNIKSTNELKFDQLEAKTLNEVTQDFMNFYNSPLKFLKETGKLGLSGVGRYAGVMGIFIGMNFLLFVYALFHLIYNGFSIDQIKYVFLVLLFCILFSVFASIKTYRFVLVKALSEFYEKIRPLLFKMCELIINQAEKLFKQSQNITDEKVRQAIDYTRIVNDYFNKLPRLLKKGLIFILNRIPLYPQLMQVSTDIQHGRKKEASKLLFENIDGVIFNFFADNNLKWIYWLLPINLIGISALIIYTLG